MSINWSSSERPNRPETPEDVIAEFVAGPFPSQETQEIDLTEDFQSQAKESSDYEMETVVSQPEAPQPTTAQDQDSSAGPITSRINVGALKSRLKSLSAPVPSVVASSTPPVFGSPVDTKVEPEVADVPTSVPPRSRAAARAESRTHRADSRSSEQDLVPTKQAHLFVTHLDPWSVAKGAFVLGVTLAGITIVATVALWLMLSAAGVFEAVTGIFNDVSGSGGGVSFLSLGRLIGLSMVVSAIEIVLISVMSTIFAVLYNLSVGFTGGIEVTLTDRSA